MLPRLDLGLDVRLAGRLEPDLGIHFQRHAGEELPDLPPHGLALEEPPHLLRDDAGHVAARLVGLREQERQRVLGQLHVADEVPDPFLGHEERAYSGEYGAPHDLGNEPFGRHVLQMLHAPGSARRGRQLVVLPAHGPAPRRTVNFASASFVCSRRPLVARSDTVTSCPFCSWFSTRSSSMVSVPRVASLAIP